MSIRNHGFSFLLTSIIAVFVGEMSTGPAKALFMDEISTGLDNSSTFQIVKYMRQMVHVMNNTG